MIDFRPLYATLESAGTVEFVRNLSFRMEKAFAYDLHKDMAAWREVVDELPKTQPSEIDLSSMVRIGCREDVSETEFARLVEGLQKLHPWRKGPYRLFGVEIDSEWRSDWKWERLQHAIAPLTNRLVLDVGCGNGYHCWRIYGAGARMVVGIDPTLLNVMQFYAIRAIYGDAPVYVLPLGIEDMTPDVKLFDTVFSMGVLYHRRSPIDHLMELRSCLRPGGELVLETLVIEGGADKVLVPENRYSQMRNVWFLPSCEALKVWLQRCGYKNIRVIDITKTTVMEQRSTSWMRFYSLSQFLNPNNNDLTIEGLPAPMRAILIANE